MNEELHKPTQEELEELFSEQEEEKQYKPLNNEELKEIFEENFMV